MNWDAISAIAEIAGVIVVVASLMYVARQLGQNTEMMRAEARNAIHHSTQQELFTIVDHPDIWRGFSDEEQDDDGIRLMMWLIASLRAREHEWFQYQSGALDKAFWQSSANAIPLVIGNKKTRVWWDTVRPTFDSQFAEIVDELLDAQDLNHMHKAQVSAVSPTSDD